MKVTSKKAIDFPKLGWAIGAGEEKELPTFKTEKETKEAQERILQETEVTIVKDKNNKLDK